MHAGSAGAATVMVGAHLEVFGVQIRSQLVFGAEQA